VDPKKENSITLDLAALNATTVAKAEILTSKSFSDFNSFDNPNVVKPANFDGATVKKGELTVKLPPMSVVTVELK
jgi:alpha-N-arabinofuranosidase